MAVLRFLASWVGGFIVLLLRLSCRIRFHDDPRPGIRREGRPYAFAILHGQQLGAVLAAEPGTAAMVSRSTDGDLLVPALRVSHVLPVRGSTHLGGRDKGGAQALDQLIDHVKAGQPAYFAVDGPRGPRGEVNRGIARLALATNAAVITAIPVPRRRWVLSRTWDRFQIPKPFSQIDAYFAEPIFPNAGESVEELRLRIQASLANLEREHDPTEEVLGREAAERQRKKLARGHRSS
jgi:lysophospholipid acyltransferase (LPLAT)-like uncharacterized protein